jgi:thiamine biosynthesis lipoprotein
VTVVAKDGATADALDTAVYVLGPQEGLALVESIDDCGAVIVDAKNKVWVSKRLESRVQVLKQPTDGL